MIHLGAALAAILFSWDASSMRPLSNPSMSGIPRHRSIIQYMCEIQILPPIWAKPINWFQSLYPSTRRNQFIFWRTIQKRGSIWRHGMGSEKRRRRMLKATRAYIPQGRPIRIFWWRRFMICASSHFRLDFSPFRVRTGVSLDLAVWPKPFRSSARRWWRCWNGWLK